MIELRSPSFNDHTLLPARHSYDGGNVSPALEWDGVPDETAELVLVCEDPDVPGKTWLHWLVTGIDPSTQGVAEGQEPSGTAWTNDFGEKGYGGPLPPVGDDVHRYFFRVYALASPLDLSADASIDDVRAAIDRTRLAAGTLVVLYAR